MSKKPWLEKLAYFIEPHLSAREVKAFLLANFTRLSEKANSTGGSEFEICRLRHLLGALGWIKADEALHPDHLYTALDLTEAQDWVARLPDGHCLRGGVLVPGIGKFLDRLDEQGLAAERVDEEAERLLKHIETRRQKSITRFTEEMSARENLKERIDVSIFLSRYARRHSDLRFINTAFKLNEWLVREYRAIKKAGLEAAFLLALAEQESSAQEWMA